MKVRAFFALALLGAASSAAAQEPPPPAGTPVPSPAAQLPVAPLAPVVGSPTAPAETGKPAAAPPSSGTLLLVLGSLGLAGGVAEFAFMPLCGASRVPSSQRPACLGVSAGAGAALLGAGIGLVVVGAQRRAAWLTWTQGAKIGLAPGGASFGWGASW